MCFGNSSKDYMCNWRIQILRACPMSLQYKFWEPKAKTWRSTLLKIIHAQIPITSLVGENLTSWTSITWIARTFYNWSQRSTTNLQKSRKFQCFVNCHSKCSRTLNCPHQKNGNKNGDKKIKLWHYESFSKWVESINSTPIFSPYPSMLCS